MSENYMKLALDSNADFETQMQQEIEKVVNDTQNILESNEIETPQNIESNDESNTRLQDNQTQNIQDNMTQDSINQDFTQKDSVIQDSTTTDSTDSTNEGENIESNEANPAQNHIENTQPTEQHNEPNIEQNIDLNTEHIEQDMPQDSVESTQDTESEQEHYENEIYNDTQAPQNEVQNTIDKIQYGAIKARNEAKTEISKVENIESDFIHTLITKQGLDSISWISIGVALFVAYFLCVRYIRIGKIIFMGIFGAYSFEMYNIEGFTPNIVWLGIIGIGLLAGSITWDFKLVKLEKEWGKDNTTKNLLLVNVVKFNLLFLLFFVVYIYIHVYHNSLDAWLAFFAMWWLNVYYKRAKFICNSIATITGWATSIDSNSYAPVMSVFGNFKEFQDEKDFVDEKKEKLLATLRIILQDTLQDLQNQGKINIKKIGEYEYIIGDKFYARLLESASNIARKKDRITSKEALDKIKPIMEVDTLGVEDIFILTECVSKHIFGTSEYYIHNIHLDKFVFCECCGIGKRRGKNDNYGMWYCSEICENTEHICMAISEELNPTMQAGESGIEYTQRREHNIAEFDRMVDELIENKREKGPVLTNIVFGVIDSKYMFYDFDSKINYGDIDNTKQGKIPNDSMKKASDYGAIGAGAIGAGEIWNQNKNITGSGTGHGVFAEKMNHQKDIELLGKDKALHVGSDNAKHGPDRIVDGVQIQTKYYATAKGSVNSAFGDNGEFRYFDENGKPMQIEVPSDQYDAAVVEMQQKITEGKVPGVTNPNEATNLVRKGHFTYDEVRFHAKFLNKEVFVREIKTSAISAGIAGGISFVVSTAICYYRNGDIKEAMRQSFIIGLKTAGKSFAISFAGAQIQKFDTFAAIKGSNHALKGTIVTALATLAVTSSIELLQMARGKISSAQFFKNVMQNTGGIVGGAAGALIGAAALSFIPVVGTIAGVVLGGVLGGILGDGAAKKFMDNFIEEDINKKYRIFYGQMTNLAMLFKLSNDEMSEFSNLVDNIVGDGAKFFSEFSASEMLPYANSVLKPLVVMIVSRRPKLLPSQFNDKYIQEVITQEAEELAQISA